MVNDVRAAEIVGVRPSTMRAWRNTHTGPRYERIAGWAIVYRESDLIAFKKERDARLRAKPYRTSSAHA
jgi:hypothetical protein